MIPLLRRPLLLSRCLLHLIVLAAPAVTTCAADGPFALQFDGVDDYVAVPHATTFNNDQFTVTAWIKTSQTAGEQGVVNKYVNGSFNGWNLFLFNGEVRAWYFGNNANYVWDGGRGLNGGFVANGQWHHLAFTVAFDGGRLYVDGVLRASMPWTGSTRDTTTTQELRLGSYPGSGFYNGLIDEVTVWSRTLDAAQISAIRSNSIVTTDFELRGYFRINEGSGTTTANTAVGRPNSTATLTNGVVWVPGVLLKPGVLTRPALAIASTSARLSGIGSAGGTNAIGWFEWGTTTGYGGVTPAQSLGGGGNETNFIHTLTGLTSDVLIHYRAVASNAIGTTFGADATFTPLHLSLGQEREGHTTTLLPNGKILVTGGYGASVNGSGFPTNSAELFDPATGLWTPISPMNTNRAFHTATLLQNGKVLVVDAQSTELYDPSSGTWLPTARAIGSHNLHTATLLQNGKVLVAGGLGNQPEIYDPASGTWTFTGPLNISRYRHTATLLANGKVLVAGGEGAAQVALTSAELYDPVSGTWTNTGSMNDTRMLHTATLQLNGRVLAVGGSTRTNYLANSERYDPLTGNWSRVGEPLLHARGYHTATLLPRGAVLITGGYPRPSPLAEVLEMNSDVWRAADVQPSVSRWDHTATLLPGGRVLLVGGYDDNTTPIASVEMYDPHEAFWATNMPMTGLRYGHTSTLLTNGRVMIASFGGTEIFNPGGAWSNAPALNNPRYSHTATLLRDGRVLVAGGIDGGFNGTATTELFDPALGTWANAGLMSTSRFSHTATLLPNGKVLVAGGSPAVLSGLPAASADLYDPVSGLWTNTGSMTQRRTGHSATLLPNGKVLVTGGSPDNFTILATAELYDFASGTWTAINSMTTNRTGHKAILLPNGTVLVAGGSANSLGIALASAEIFNPADGTWQPVAAMTAARLNPTATLLPNGRVLVAGGYGAGYISSAELYDPATRTWTATASKTGGTYQHAATLLPNGRVLVTGGWNGQTGTNRVELYDAGLGFQPLFAPIITNRTSPLALGGSLGLGGFRFRGVSAAAGGRDKDSPSDNPIVQLRALDSERTVTLSSTNWTAITYASMPVSGALPGWVMATMFVNGIPSTASILEISAPVATPPLLTDEKRLPDGSFQFRFTNNVGALFGAIATTNVAQPPANWTPLGVVSEIAPGRFQFTDPQGTNQPRRFYRARSL